MSDAILAGDRKSMRRVLRARRRAITPGERKESARLIAHHADCWLRLRPSWRIALYAALPEKLDSTPLIELARARGCRVYLPRIDRHTLWRKMQCVAMNDRQRS